MGGAAILLCALHAPAALAQAADPIREETRTEEVATGEQAPASEPPARPDALLTVNGEIGLTSFDYGNYFHSRQESSDLAVGGNLVVHTAQVAGFSAGAGVYVGQTLGLYDRDGRTYNPELASTDGNRTSLRQAYVQYQSGRLLVRAGRQMLQTPFVTQDYFTFHPRAFTGVAARFDVIGRTSTATDTAVMNLDASPAKLTVLAARMYDYAGRFVDGFTEGSEVSGGLETEGFLALGTRYKGSVGGTKLVAQAWYYDFVDYARLAYGHVAVRAPIAPDRELVGAAQVFREWNSSGNGRALLAATNGNASSIDATIYGLTAGVRLGKVTVSAIGNYAPERRGAFRNGGALQPYSMIPFTLFTDTLQTGVAELGPGYGYGLNVTVKALNDRLSASLSGVRYQAEYGTGKNFYTYRNTLGFGSSSLMPDQRSWAIDSINILDLSNVVKGLSATYVLGIARTENRPGFPHYENPFIISRIYLKYAF